MPRSPRFFAYDEPFFSFKLSLTDGALGENYEWLSRLEAEGLGFSLLDRQTKKASTRWATVEALSNALARVLTRSERKSSQASGRITSAVKYDFGMRNPSESFTFCFPTGKRAGPRKVCVIVLLSLLKYPSHSNRLTV